MRQLSTNVLHRLFVDKRVINILRLVIWGRPFWARGNRGSNSARIFKGTPRVLRTRRGFVQKVSIYSYGRYIVLGGKIFSSSTTLRRASHYGYENEFEYLKACDDIEEDFWIVSRSMCEVPDLCESWTSNCYENIVRAAASCREIECIWQGETDINIWLDQHTVFPRPLYFGPPSAEFWLYWSRACQYFTDVSSLRSCVRITTVWWSPHATDKKYSAL